MSEVGTATGVGSRIAIVGGAGFIGSHFTDRLLDDPDVEQVTIYDNFTSGREWHFAHHVDDARLTVRHAEVSDLDELTTAVTGHHTVIHLASNPDIAKAMTDPTVDFHEGTALTHNVAEAVRRAEVDLVLYASGSGIYGDLGDTAATEAHGPLVPVSTYGASKLAGEALLCSYAHMFGLRAVAFRFANVVGPRQTHGIGFDFVRKLRADPGHLDVLGDGTQSKSYIYVEDVVDAVLFVAANGPAVPFDAYNVSTPDYITVREIVALAIECVGLDSANVDVSYGTSDRGWKGDVPVVRLSTERINALGWRCRRNTTAALREAIESMQADAQGGRLT